MPSGNDPRETEKTVEKPEEKVDSSAESSRSEDELSHEEVAEIRRLLEEQSYREESGEESRPRLPAEEQFEAAEEELREKQNIDEIAKSSVDLGFHVFEGIFTILAVSIYFGIVTTSLPPGIGAGACMGIVASLEFLRRFIFSLENYRDSFGR